MLPKKRIDALLQPVGKYWLIVFYWLMICLLIASFFIFLSLKYHKLWIMLMVPLSVIPAIFFRLKINLFTKKVTISFSDLGIEINSSDSLNERFVYSDIKYFSTSNISADNASRINFILRNGIKKKYIFFRQLDNEENVLNNVLLYFSSYNRDKSQEEKIQILPGFFLSKSGRLFVAITAFSILAATIIQIIFIPKTIPYSLLIVLSGYIQIKSTQLRDRKILEKFSDEN
jgi:hypothetical protein